MRKMRRPFARSTTQCSGRRSTPVKAVGLATISLCGYSAVSDLYLDNMRDVAQYNRDTFNLEQVDVLQRVIFDAVLSAV